MLSSSQALKLILEFCIKCIGLLLLVAATTKCIPMFDTLFYFTSSLSQMTWEQRLSLLATPIEIWLGLKLLRESPSVVTLLISSVLFGLLAVASIALTSMGVADCGCFGRVSTAPVLRLILNLTSCGLLAFYARLLTRSTCRERSEAQSQAVDSNAGTLLFAGVILAIYAAGPFIGIAAISRSPVIAAYAVRAKVHSLPEYRRFFVPIRNISESAVVVDGGDQFCGLHVATEFPLVIEPGETKLITVEAKNATQARTIKMEFSLFGRRDGGKTEVYRCRVLGNWEAIGRDEILVGLAYTGWRVQIATNALCRSCVLAN